jgi:ribosomal protein L5
LLSVNVRSVSVKEATVLLSAVDELEELAGVSARATKAKNKKRPMTKKTAKDLPKKILIEDICV